MRAAAGPVRSHVTHTAHLVMPTMGCALRAAPKEWNGVRRLRDSAMRRQGRRRHPSATACYANAESVIPMDVVQFGRWLGERRRACGWTSQRALMASAQEHPHTRDLGISEAFLARLEAGLLAYPFRGAVRKRVLALIWLLCQSPRQIRDYLRLAGLANLNSEEQEIIRSALASFITSSTTAALLLPARPVRLLGQAAALNDLLHMLRTSESGLCVVAGMPGVGKSVLASEALHLLVADEQTCHALFPDGILTCSGVGRRGAYGLIALLDELCTVFGANPLTGLAAGRQGDKPRQSGDRIARPDLAGVLNRTRAAVAGKRFLLLIDDMDARFPLREALDAVLATGHAAGVAGAPETERRVVLVTSRFVPEAGLTRMRLDVPLLDDDAALSLLTTLLQRDLGPGELPHARGICRAVGNVPLAIELAATAVLSEGIPLPLLEARLARHALIISTDSGRELRQRLEHELDALDADARELFALVSALGTPEFTLHAAAALRDARWPASSTGEAIPEPARVLDNAARTAAGEDRLARTAALLGQLVRHSLLSAEGEACYGGNEGDRDDCGRGVRYRLHPLVYAYARERLNLLGVVPRGHAHENVQRYAMRFLA